MAGLILAFPQEMGDRPRPLSPGRQQRAPRCFLPAAFDNVVSVAAFDEGHRRPSFSNYGSWVDI